MAHCVTNHLTYNWPLVCESWLPCRLTEGFLTFELLSFGFCLSFAATSCKGVPPTATTGKRQIINSNRKHHINSHGTRIGSQITYGNTGDPPPPHARQPTSQKSESQGPKRRAPGIMGVLGGGGGGAQSEQQLCIMTRHASCCVLLCTNNFRNSPGLEFYRVPKTGRIQREHVRLFANANLKLNSDSTRIYIRRKVWSHQVLVTCWVLFEDNHVVWSEAN